MKNAFDIFKKRPFQLTALFIPYMFLLFLLGRLPYIGQVLPALVSPLFSMVLLFACAQIFQQGLFDIKQIKSQFNVQNIQRLLVLGFISFLYGTVAFSLTWLAFGGNVADLPNIPADAISSLNVNPIFGVLTAGLFSFLYFPLFWFAAPLIAWKNLSVPKAVFFSAHAFFTYFKAFSVHALVWVVIGIIIPAIFAAVIVSISGAPQLAIIVLLTLSISLSALMYCACYVAYVHIFGSPDLTSS